MTTINDDNAVNTTVTEPSTPTPNPTMELTIDEFRTLPNKTQKVEPETQEAPDIEYFSDDYMEPSPGITNTKPIQTIFKIQREITSDSEDNPNTRTISREQRNAVIKVCIELHKYNFRDVDKLQNINMDKTRRIISKAIYIQLGDYDPSNEYTTNYSDV